MKFFTPELYLEINSRDLGLVEKAHEKWENAIDRYRKHLAEIRPRMTPNARKLAQSVCLHDATFLGLGLMFLPSSIGKHAIITLRQGEMQVFLFYLLFKDPLIEEVKSWPFSSKTVDWLYDEFDIQPDGGQQHEVLLSDGRVLTLSFYEMWLYKAALPEMASYKSATSSERLPMVGSREQARRSR